MNFIQNIKNQLQDAIDNSLGVLKNQQELNFEQIPSYAIEVPRERDHGDFAANVAMLMAKEARMAPRKIAELILGQMKVPTELVEKVELAGAGFINFYLKPDWLYQVPGAILGLGESYGKAPKNGRKVQVEFVSANPTGDLHMGNARGGAIGDTLASILDAAGFLVQREYYINDAGNQMDLFGQSLEARYMELLGEPFVFPEGGYAGQDVINTVKEAMEEFGDCLLELQSEDRKKKLADFALRQKVQYIKNTLQGFNIEYDEWFSESSLYASGEVDRIINELTDKGYIYEKEGAKWFRAATNTEEKDEVVVRANGMPTYFAADIAYHQNKFERGFEWVIDVWGADHHGHVARMKSAMSALGYDPNRLDVILMQLVRLYRGGEIVRMSKRTGTLVTLDELIEEVGQDVARFFFVMRSPDSHLDFDLELAKKESQENPVYYVQYAHARVCSIMRTAVAQGIQLPVLEQTDITVLQEKEEIELLKKLAEFPEEVQIAAKAMAPQRIPHYVLELAGLLHSFYFNHKVLSESDKIRNARLILTESVRITIANALAMIGVNAPERM